MPVFCFALFTSALSLAAAFAAQYGFGLMPCELCILQRLPYGVVIALSLFGIGVKFILPDGGAVSKALPYLIILAFLTDSGIAVYHSAVEKHVIKGPSACTSSKPASVTESLEDFRRRIENAPAVACDQPAWQFHGITMANLNALWSFALAVMVFILRKRYAKAAG